MFKAFDLDREQSQIRFFFRKDRFRSDQDQLHTDPNSWTKFIRFRAVLFKKQQLRTTIFSNDIKECLYINAMVMLVCCPNRPKSKASHK